MNELVDEFVPDDLNNDFTAIEPVGEASKRAEVAYSMSTDYLII